MKSKGITCPKCGESRLKTVSVRKPMTGVIVRYRRCKCGEWLTTEERIRKKKFATA